VDVKSEGDSPAELLGEAADSTMLCRVFVRIAEQGDSPSPSDDYDVALEQIGLVIDHIEEARELLRLRLAMQNARRS
jgi:hypothetical protein